MLLQVFWVQLLSFSTKDFPENKNAKSGDVVRIIQCDIDDKRPVEDIIWTHETYQETYRKSKLKILRVYRPLGKPEEPYEWINETKIAPWVIYVLSKS